MDLNSAVQTILSYRAAKWNDLQWVRGQLQKHVEEISLLQATADSHTLAELTDYEIILALASAAGMTSTEVSTWRNKIQHAFSGAQDTTDADRYTVRLAKFLSKINL